MKTIRLPLSFIFSVETDTLEGVITLGDYTIHVLEKRVELHYLESLVLNTPKGRFIKVIKTDGQLHLKVSEIVLGAEGLPYDSSFWPTGSLYTERVPFHVEGELSVIKAELSDIQGYNYLEAVEFMPGEKILTPEGTFDFFQEFNHRVGVDTDAELGNGLYMKEGNYCHTVPLDLRGDFFLAFDFSSAVPGAFTLFRQGGVVLSVSPSVVKLEVGAEVITVPYEHLSSNRVVLDRFEGVLTLQCNDEHYTYAGAFMSSKSAKATIFEGFLGIVECVAYSTKSYLRGRLCSDYQIRNTIKFKDNIYVDRQSPFMFRVDGDWDLQVDDNDCVNIGFIAEGDTEICSAIGIREGKLVIQGTEFGNFDTSALVSLHKKGSTFDVYVDRAFVGNVPSEETITGIEGNYRIFCCSTQAGFDITIQPLEFASLPLAITGATQDIEAPAEVSYVDELGRVNSFTATVNTLTLGQPLIKVAEFDTSGERRLYSDILRKTTVSLGVGEGVMPAGLSFESSKLHFRFQGTGFVERFGASSFNYVPSSNSLDYKQPIEFEGQTLPVSTFSDRIKNRILSIDLGTGKEVGTYAKVAMFGTSDDRSDLETSEVYKVEVFVEAGVVADKVLKHINVVGIEDQIGLPAAIVGSTQILGYVDSGYDELDLQMPSKPGSSRVNGDQGYIVATEGQNLVLFGRKAMYKDLTTPAWVASYSVLVGGETYAAAAQTTGSSKVPQSGNVSTPSVDSDTVHPTIDTHGKIVQGVLGVDPSFDLGLNQACVSSKVDGRKYSYGATVSSGGDYGYRYTVLKTITFASGRTAADIRQTFNIVSSSSTYGNPRATHPAYVARFPSLYWRPRLERPVNLSYSRVGIFTSLASEGTIRVGPLENV